MSERLKVYLLNHVEGVLILLEALALALGYHGAPARDLRLTFIYTVHIMH